MHAGRVLTTGSPEALIAARGAATLEEAFISHLEEAAGAETTAPIATGNAGVIEPKVRRQPTRPRSISLRRLFAYAIREALELWRDPIRLGFALLGTTFLMLVLGFGITTDVDHLSFAALDRDRTQESRAYLEELRGSRYFDEKPPLTDYTDLEKRTRERSAQCGNRDPAQFRPGHQARALH